MNDVKPGSENRCSSSGIMPDCEDLDSWYHPDSVYVMTYAHQDKEWKVYECPNCRLLFKVCNDNLV